MTYETIEFDIKDHIATITLNRPDSANAMNEVMISELNDVSISCDDDPNIRAVLLCAIGKVFCAGGDLGTFAKAGDQVSHWLRTYASLLHQALSRFNRMHAPIIAAVSGTVGGAGLSLVSSTDLVIAGSSSKFTSAYTAAGLSPDGGLSYFLPRRIGDCRARELMLTNRLLNAEEALDWGLINRVVKDEEVLDAARQQARTFASGPTRAYSMVKGLLCETFNNGMETQMELESRGIAETVMTEDAREGINAFLNKRKPDFKGK